MGEGYIEVRRYRLCTPAGSIKCDSADAHRVAHGSGRYAWVETSIVRLLTVDLSVTLPSGTAVVLPAGTEILGPWKEVKS